MNFRFDKLTIKAQEGVAAAQALAQEQGHPEVDSLHLLAALLASATASSGRCWTRSASTPTS